MTHEKLDYKKLYCIFHFGSEGFFFVVCGFRLWEMVFPFSDQVSFSILSTKSHFISPLFTLYHNSISSQSWLSIFFKLTSGWSHCFPFPPTCQEWRMALGFLLNFPVLLSTLLNPIMREQQTGFRLHWGGKLLTEIPCFTIRVSGSVIRNSFFVCFSCLVVYGAPFPHLGENLWLY